MSAGKLSCALTGMEDRKGYCQLIIDASRVDSVIMKFHIVIVSIKYIVSTESSDQCLQNGSGAARFYQPCQLLGVSGRCWFRLGALGGVW